MPEGIIGAEDIAKEFKEHSVAEFFKKNKQMLGLVGKIRTLTTIIHEFCTNSLDACEEAKILPDIEIQLKELGSEHYEVTVKDNGPGLTKQTVGKAFGKLLAGTKFHRMVQMRGQQGIGSAGIVMLSQLTTGKATSVITGSTKGKTFACEITVDAKKNEPKIANIQDLNTQYRGTIVKARFKQVKYIKSEQSPLEYLRRTAIANPHAKIKFIDPFKEVTLFERTSKEIPKKPLEIKPHPKGIIVDEITTMAKYSDARKTSSFLKNEFDRIGDKAIREIQHLVNFDLNIDPKKLAWDDAEQIVKSFKKINFIAPRTDGLRPIGEGRIMNSLESILKPEFLSVITRKPQVYSGGFPFQVEAAIAYGGKAGRSTTDGEGGKRLEIMRFANLAPLLFDGGGCAITKAVNTIEWKRYSIRDIDNIPLTVFVNVVSVHIPYTSAGKQAIADEPEVLEEIRLTLMDLGRKTSRYIAGKLREKQKQMKRETFFKYIPEVAAALNKVTKADEAKIKKKLEKMVLNRLKLEEAMEPKALETNGENGKEDKEKTKEAKGKKPGKKKKK